MVVVSRMVGRRAKVAECLVILGEKFERRVTGYCIAEPLVDQSQINSRAA